MVMHTFCPNIRDLETGRALNSIQVQSSLPSECQGHIVKSCLKKRNPVYKIRTFIPVTQRKKPGKQNKVLWPAIQSWLFMDSGKKRLNKKRKQKRNGHHWSRVLAPDEFFKKAKYKGKDTAEGPERLGVRCRVSEKNTQTSCPRDECFFVIFFLFLLFFFFSFHSSSLVFPFYVFPEVFSIYFLVSSAAFLLYLSCFPSLTTVFFPLQLYVLQQSLPSSIKITMVTFYFPSK